MRTNIRHAPTIHRFLSSRLFYPLVLSSLLAGVIVAGRVYFTHSGMYVFLIWNLFLAWIPYLASLWAAFSHWRHPEHWWRLIIPGAVWLIFFPNAPYILTDFVHLQHTQSFTWWYDVGLIATFAWTGCFLAVASLHSMQTLVTAFLGRVVSWLFVIVTVGLSGLGIYLGRFLRWNSWDLLVNPYGVLSDIAVRVSDPLSHPRAVGVTGMFAALLFVSYLMFTAAYHRSDHEAQR